MTDAGFETRSGLDRLEAVFYLPAKSCVPAMIFTQDGK
jgi:hypothetical protein